MLHIKRKWCDKCHINAEDGNRHPKANPIFAIEIVAGKSENGEWRA